jgi:hypothetical protein
VIAGVTAPTGATTGAAAGVIVSFDAAGAGAAPLSAGAGGADANCGSPVASPRARNTGTIPPIVNTIAATAATATVYA